MLATLFAVVGCKSDRRFTEHSIAVSVLERRLQVAREAGATPDTMVLLGTCVQCAESVNSSMCCEEADTCPCATWQLVGDGRPHCILTDAFALLHLLERDKLERDVVVVASAFHISRVEFTFTHVLQNSPLVLSLRFRSSENGPVDAFWVQPTSLDKRAGLLDVLEAEAAHMRELAASGGVLHRFLGLIRASREATTRVTFLPVEHDAGAAAAVSTTDEAAAVFGTVAAAATSELPRLQRVATIRDAAMLGAQVFPAVADNVPCLVVAEPGADVAAAEVHLSVALAATSPAASPVGGTPQVSLNHVAFAVTSGSGAGSGAPGGGGGSSSVASRLLFDGTSLCASADDGFRACTATVLDSGLVLLAGVCVKFVTTVEGTRAATFSPLETLCRLPSSVPRPPYRLRCCVLAGAAPDVVLGDTPRESLTRFRAVRVDVTRHGDVVYVDEPHRAFGWLSLSGISFVACGMMHPRRFSEVPLHSGEVRSSGDGGATVHDVAVHSAIASLCDDGLVVLRGCLPLPAGGDDVDGVVLGALPRALSQFLGMSPTAPPRAFCVVSGAGSGGPAGDGDVAPCVVTLDAAGVLRYRGARGASKPAWVSVQGVSVPMANTVPRTVSVAVPRRVLPSSATHTRRTIVFLRHGQARHNELMRQGRYAEGCAVPDPLLTDVGRRQCAAAGRRLRELLRRCGRSGFDAVYSSPFRRALETTDIALQQCFPKSGDGDSDSRPVVTLLHLVAEHCHGPSKPCDTGSSVVDLRRWMSERPTTCYDIDASLVEPAGAPARWPVTEFEDDQAMCLRARAAGAFFRDLPPTLRFILVVSHGGFMRSRLSVAAPNCGVFVETV